MIAGDGEVVKEDDVFSQIDFESLYQSVFSSDDLLREENDFPVFLTDPSVQVEDVPLANSDSLSIEEIEHLLMKDDNDLEEEENHDLSNNFFSFSDFLGGEVRVSNNEDSSNPESNLSDDSQDKVSDPSPAHHIKSKNEDDDPNSKKRKRQMRNRDAALRSRERKKLYVRDLEMKSKYLESECRRLQHLLQCCVSENQSLHLLLQKDKAFGASMAKQESAVLFLESLLLGSLLWFLGIMCLFSPQGLAHPSHPPAGVLVNVVSDSLEVGAQRAGNKRRGLGTLRLFFKRKRCTKATRSKMKEIVVMFDAVPLAVM